MRDKLQALLTECSSSDLIAQWTMQDFASIMGILVNANTVVAACPSKYYYVYKFMRRRAQQQLPDNAPVRVWPSTVPILKEWISDMLFAAPRDMSAPPPARASCILVTDASLVGFGAILFFKGKAYSFRGAWPEWVLRLRMPIVELEGKTVLIAALLFSGQFPELRQANWDIVVDNTTFQQVVLKGRSPSYHLNEAVTFLLDVGISIRSVAYIASADNPADCFTRPASRPTIVNCVGHNVGDVTKKSPQ